MQMQHLAAFPKQSYAEIVFMKNSNEIRKKRYDARKVT